MFKILITSFCLLVISFASLVFAGDIPPSSIICAPRLQQCLRTIQKMPEAQELIASIQQEGPIRIAVNSHALSNQFGAYWDMEDRVIFVSLSAHSSEGELIASILFELHNASIDSKLNYFDYLASTGQIDKESYVRSIEFLEYRNSKNASKIAEKGIKLGIFPPNARLNTYENFEEHYHYQKIGGHSAWIAKTFDQIAPKKITASNR